MKHFYILAIRQLLELVEPDNWSTTTEDTFCYLSLTLRHREGLCVWPFRRWPTIIKSFHSSLCLPRIFKKRKDIKDINVALSPYWSRAWESLFIWTTLLPRLVSRLVSVPLNFERKRLCSKVAHTQSGCLADVSPWLGSHSFRTTVTTLGTKATWERTLWFSWHT